MAEQLPGVAQDLAVVVDGALAGKPLHAAGAGLEGLLLLHTGTCHAMEWGQRATKPGQDPFARSSVKEILCHILMPTHAYFIYNKYELSDTYLLQIE